MSASHWTVTVPEGGRRAPRLVTFRASGSHLGWSLVAPNGRPLGREAAVYASESALSGALHELMADRLALRYVLAQGGARDWAWTAYLPGRRSRSRDATAIARSPRGYLRQDQCRKSATGFAAALKQLPPDVWSRHVR